MTQYNQQYQQEDALFGEPYREFVEFIRAHAPNQGTALDIGCGQGRDALMLAEYGYTVTGVDASQVGIDQMVAEAQAKNLAVTGIVADFYLYQPDAFYDAIVLDSILHFQKADKAKELALLTRLAARVKVNGYLFIFIHKSAAKEKALHKWASMHPDLMVVQDQYIDYVYEEKSSGFRSPFQFYMSIMRKVGY